MHSEEQADTQRSEERWCAWIYFHLCCSINSFDKRNDRSVSFTCCQKGERNCRINIKRRYQSTEKKLITIEKVKRKKPRLKITIPRKKDLFQCAERTNEQTKMILNFSQIGKHTHRQHEEEQDEETFITIIEKECLFMFWWFQWKDKDKQRWAISSGNRCASKESHIQKNKEKEKRK